MNSEEKRIMVMAEVNRLSNKLFEASETTDEYLAAMLSVSQYLMAGVIEIASEQSGNSLPENIEFFTESFKQNVTLILTQKMMVKKDDGEK